jgi:hypothetical protein
VNYAVGPNATSVVVGDFNGDGTPDLAVANLSSNDVSVLLGNGDGTFLAAVNYAVGAHPDSVAAADFNGDGNPDLATANALGRNLSVLLGNGDGTFQAAVNYAVGTASSNPRSIAVGDFNSDGKPDLAVANYKDNNVSVLLNTTGLVKATTSTMLAASPNPSVFGQSVTFTAAVTSSAAGVPTGTVTFQDGATPLGTGTVNGSGQATLTTAALSAGAHTITAAYSGDTNFAASTSSAVAQTVSHATTMSTLNSSPNPSTVGQTVNLMATVVGQYGGAATGTVTFKEGTTKVLGTASLVNGVATLPLSTLSTGSHTLRAVYGGDANSNGSTSAAITQTVVAKTATGTTISSSLNPSFVGQSVTFTATVSPSSATGTVTFKAGQTVLGTGSLSSGTATFSTSTLSAGSFNIVAIYGGDAQFATSTSGSLTQTVNKASTTTVLSSAPNPSSVGQLVTFTANVTSSTGVTPSGTVRFLQGSTMLGTGIVGGTGTATFSTSTLTKGTHNVKAVYGATNAFSSSTSAIVTQVVQ